MKPVAPLVSAVLTRAGSTSRIRRSWHRHTVKKITAYLVFRIAEGACWDRGVPGKPLARGIKIVVGTLKDLGGKNVDGRGERICVLMDSCDIQDVCIVCNDPSSCPCLLRQGHPTKTGTDKEKHEPA